MFLSMYSKFFLIFNLLVIVGYSSNAQSYKQYRNSSDYRLDQRSRAIRFHHHDKLRYHPDRKGNRFRPHRHVLRKRCAPTVRSHAFRNGFRKGFRLRGEFENRNLRNRSFRSNRWGDRESRGGRIRSL